MPGESITRDSDGATIDLAQEEAEHADTTANAKRVILVNSSGTIIKGTQIPEDRLGAECSGSDGTSERVLTLANTSESGAPVAVWVEDQLINPADYTVSHLSASSTITFDNINVFDLDTIHINYQI